MQIGKEHKEFYTVDIYGDGWHTPTGYPPGIQHKILAGRLDEITGTGSRTRLLDRVLAAVGLNVQQHVGLQRNLAQWHPGTDPSNFMRTTCPASP
jgi:hypothetical protein